MDPVDGCAVAWPPEDPMLDVQTFNTRSAVKALADTGRSLNLATVLLLAALLAFLLLKPVGWYPSLARFSEAGISSLANVLAPLVVLALFIERAVEVVMTAWRAEGQRWRKDRLEHEKKLAERSCHYDEAWRAYQELNAYVAVSQRLAFLTAIVFGFLVSIVGVRAMEMLMEAGAVVAQPVSQRDWFIGVDIALTSLLLAGGADGIHRLVITFQAFVTSTRERLRDEPTAPRLG
jgi:hypothetical protein